SELTHFWRNACIGLRLDSTSIQPQRPTTEEKKNGYGRRYPPPESACARADAEQAELCRRQRERHRALDRQSAQGQYRRNRPPRSEEHTSELQSRENLVCR